MSRSPGTKLYLWNTVTVACTSSCTPSWSGTKIDQSSLFPPSWLLHAPQRLRNDTHCISFYHYHTFSLCIQGSFCIVFMEIGGLKAGFATVASMSSSVWPEKVSSAATKLAPRPLRRWKPFEAAGPKTTQQLQTTAKHSLCWCDRL